MEDLVSTNTTTSTINLYLQRKDADGGRKSSAHLVNWKLRSLVDGKTAICSTKYHLRLQRREGSHNATTYYCNFAFLNAHLYVAFLTWLEFYFLSKSHITSPIRILLQIIT